MSDKKVLFFDIDGTLLDSKGQIPPSTREALQMAKEAGHTLAICSGRAKCQMDEDITDGFDAVISCTGANVEYQGKSVAGHTMTREQLERMVGYFEKYKMCYMLQAASRLIMPSYFLEELKKEVEDPNSTMKRFKKFFVFTDQYEDMLASLDELQDVEKACYFTCPVTPDEVQEGIGEDLLREDMSYDKPNPNLGEITIRKYTKSSAMKELIDYLGMGQEDTIAFGDGPNDMDMIQYAGIGVAMGNAREELKAVADYVTTSVDEDGIYNAMGKVL